MMLSKRLGACAVLLGACLLAAPAFAPNCRAWTWLGGHQAAADNGPTELPPPAPAAITAAAPVGDDDVFGDDTCGQLLETIYEYCHYNLIFTPGQPIFGQQAETMCENNDPANGWACLEACKAEATTCAAFSDCTLKTCNIAVQQQPSGGSSSSSRTGCGS